MKCQNFSCYTKNNNVLSVGMNLNNIIAKHYYSENTMNCGGFRKKLNIPLPLMLLNHEHSFLKNTIINNQMGGKKIKNKNNDIISDSLFDKLIDIKSKTNLKQTRKHKKGGAKRKKKKTKKNFMF